MFVKVFYFVFGSLLCFHKNTHGFSFDNVTLEGRLPFRPPVCGYMPPPCQAGNWIRRLDGSCTNPSKPSRGTTGDLYDYILTPRYQDGISGARNSLRGAKLPSTRKVKNALFFDGSAPSPQWNYMSMTWGQLMAHDISQMLTTNDNRIRCCDDHGKFQSNMSPHCLPIAVPRDDPQMSSKNISCMNNTRAISDMDVSCGGANPYASPLNAVTAALDLSPVYGNGDKEGDLLREKSGGRLLARIINGLEYLPITNSTVKNCKTAHITGDSRGDQNLGLISLHTLLMREHNRLARRLEDLNFHWEDERLYQESRRILIAQYQYISYYEWLPIILGEDILLEAEVIFASTNSYVDDFFPNISPAPSVEFSHAAFRYFHTNIPEHIELMDDERKIVQKITLSDNLFCQDIVENVNVLQQVHMGIVTQPMAEFDVQHAPSLTENFDKHHTTGFGKDVRSFDIERGRDMGLASYSVYKLVCNVGFAKTFDDFLDFISPSKVDILKKMYPSSDAVDLSVGCALEEHVEGSNVGPTYQCILVDQFLRLRQGDRLWFEHRASGFTPIQLAAIKKNSNIARMMCNSGERITRIQPDAFSIVDDVNVPVQCIKIDDIDLTPWIEINH